LPEIHEPPARAVAVLADRVSRCEGALQDFVVVDRPTRPVLHAFASGGEEVAVHAGRLATLLDELELNVARVGERDRHMDVVVARAAIAEFGDGKLVGVEPRADAAHVDPVLHRRLDVAHDDSDLTHLAEQTTHQSAVPRGGAAWATVMVRFSSVW